MNVGGGGGGGFKPSGISWHAEKGKQNKIFYQAMNSSQNWPFINISQTYLDDSWIQKI